MNRNPVSIRVVISLLGFAAIMGLISGILVVGLFACLDTFNNWQRISTPQDKAVELLDYDYPLFIGDRAAYVKTATGTIYACSPSYRANGRGCVKASYPPEHLIVNTCCDKIYSTPKPPGAVVSELKVCPCVEDCSVQVNLILLDDGSVWKWEKADCEMVFFGRVLLALVGAGCGATLGLIGGFAILLLKCRRQRQAT
jgi:hypothetical protein